MSSAGKLIERLRGRPVEMSVTEVEAVLRHFGWTLDRTRGSHRTYVKPGQWPITVATHSMKLKRGYLVAIAKVLDLEADDKEQE